MNYYIDLIKNKLLQKPIKEKQRTLMGTFRLPVTLFSILLLLTFLLSCQKETNTLTIKGRILGADEQPPPLAHVHAAAMGQNPLKAKYRVATDPDGRFELHLPKGKLWTLMVTAVNHNPLKIPLVLENNTDEVNIRFRLTANLYRNDFAGVKIIGDWNKFNFNDAQAMVPMADGTYSFEIYITADTVGYQIVNATKTDRSVNGTMADHYRYDGGGDYISVLKVNKGMVKIKFDPSKLLRGEPGDMPEIAFEDGEEYQNKMMEIVARAESEREKVRIAMQNNQADPNFRYDLSPVQILFEKYMDQQPPLLAKFAALHYAELIYLGMQPDSTSFKRVMELLPLQDPLWALKPYLIVDVYHIALGKEKARELFKKEKKNIQDRRARAFVLVDLGMEALANGDAELSKKYYNDLILNYSDIPAIIPAIKQLDPNRKIVKGKPVPDFLVKLLSENRWITSKDLKGRYFLIHFWATWNDESVKQIPKLIQVYRSFPHDKFGILSLNFDMKLSKLKEFHKNKYAMPWWNSFIHELHRYDLRNDFEVGAFPYYILVDPEGKIIASNKELQVGNLLSILKRYIR